MNESSYKKMYHDLLAIISEQSGEPVKKLSLETTINKDLGVYGDDWDQLIEPVIKKYPITDWSAFVFLDHMCGEGYGAPLFIANTFVFIPKLIIAAIMFPFNQEKSAAIFKYKPFEEVQHKDNPLYIADIFNSVIKGKWEYAKDSELDLHALIQ